MILVSVVNYLVAKVVRAELCAATPHKCGITLKACDNPIIANRRCAEYLTSSVAHLYACPLVNDAKQRRGGGRCSHRRAARQGDAGTSLVGGNEDLVLCSPLVERHIHSVWKELW